MAKDPYSVLGVAKDASADAIRKAYRDLAKTLHPDLNPDDAKAAERFKEVSAAYDLLKDPEKRARFDRGEIDASGAETPKQRYYRDFAESGEGERYYTSGGFGDAGDISDLFSELFGARGAGGGRGPGGGRARRTSMKGQDVRYRLEVEFLEAAKGAKKRITTPEGESIDLTIPAGVSDGRTLRMKGKGGPGVGGGPAGDAFVEIAVRPHRIFTRDGDDILLDLPISFDEAVLGGKVEAPTIDGPVSLTIPKGASSGQTLRLRGRGVARGKGKDRGDQLVRLKIVAPKEVDEELSGFMEEWRKTHSYDPRKGL